MIFIFVNFNFQTILHHLYTEISACGRRTDKLLNYAYIAGYVLTSPVISLVGGFINKLFNTVFIWNIETFALLILI